jgi:hypothetical protein
LARRPRRGRAADPANDIRRKFWRKVAGARRRGIHIERHGEQYLAYWISGVAIFPCAGNRDEVSERALAESMAKGSSQKVTRLYRNQEIPEECCWVRGSGWCLAYS